MYRLNEEIKNKLFGMAMAYEESELQLFQDHLGWEDWMNEFSTAEDGEEITEAESKEIDSITEEIFNLAHNHPTFTKAWKVYGAEGHRQRESFAPSASYNFSKFDDVRIVVVKNSDVTGTNEYSIVEITRNTEAECDAEFEGQLSDGIFENSKTGKIEVIEQC